MDRKPYVRMTGKDPQGVPWNYKDLLKTSALSEDQVDTVLANTTVIQNLITPLSNSTPLIDVGAGDPGTSTEVSRSDHVHPIIADATTAVKGKVELATSGENAANVVVQGNDSRINVLTTKGDIYTYSNAPARLAVGADGMTLVADASQATGLKWMTYSSAWFGSGTDGSSTLGGNTTLASRVSYVRNYTTLDLANFTLTHNSGDRAATYCASVLLTGNGGSIVACVHTTGGAGGAARVQGGSSGAGGTGGSGVIGFFVYARKVSGTVTINGNGGNATNGGNASGTPTGTQTGAAGTNGSSDNYMHGANIQSGAIAAAGGGGAAGGTAGGASTPQVIAENISGLYDPFRYFYSNRTFVISSESLGTVAMRDVRSAVGSGGGSGGIASASAASGGGGGAGGYSVANTAGVAGGAGGAGASTIGAGGGGGGSGAIGTFVGVMVGEFASGATFTATANGGNGGNGGNGVVNGGGGGGGAGGNGGMIYAVLPVNYSNTATVSVTATGGTKGSKGLKAGSGSDGVDSTNGAAGVASIMTWFS